jgi:hypothetical protein
MATLFEGAGSMSRSSIPVGSRVRELAGIVVDAAGDELHLCKFVAGDVCIDKKSSVVRGDHNRLTFNSLRTIFPVPRVDVSIPSTESGNDAGSVAKGK